MPSKEDILELQKIVEIARSIIPDDHFSRMYHTAGAVITRFLGEDFYNRHISADKVQTGFFRAGTKPGSVRAYSGVINTIRLAEYLFNLKDVPGFVEVATALRTKDPQFRFAELEAAYILYLSGVPFYFKIAEGVKGKDYDLEVLVDGRPAAAEIKCRNENDALSEKAVLRTLTSACDQLPEDRPGIIIYKIPQSWVDDGLGQEIIALRPRVAAELFRKRERVVSVIFYSSLNSFEHNKSIMFSNEYVSDRHRFDTSLDWEVIKTENKGRYPPWIVLQDICA